MRKGLSSHAGKPTLYPSPAARLLLDIELDSRRTQQNLCHFVALDCFQKYGPTALVVIQRIRAVRPTK